MRFLPVVLLLGAAATAVQAQEKKPLTIEGFITTPMVGDPQLAPDGGLVAFTIGTPSLDSNRITTKVWLADVATGESWQALSGTGNDRAPRWSARSGS